MHLIDKFSLNITNKISSTLKLDSDKTEIIGYGVFMIIQTILSIIATLVSGFIFGVLIEIIAISIVSSTLRKNSGGVHASSPGICILLGATTFTILALLTKLIIEVNINILIIATIIIFVWSYYIIIKKCPVEAPTKPIRNLEKRKKLKRKTINTLTIYIISTCVLSYFYFSLNNLFLLKLTICIVLGVFWQMVTLTTLGGNAMHIIDNFFTNFTKEGGEIK